MDSQLFLLINHLPHNVLFDTLAKILSGIGTAGIIWLIFGILLYISEEKKYIKFFLPFFFAGGVSYILVEYMLKPLIGRVRPTVEMGALIIGGTRSDYSMPSGHATIAFAMAVVLSSYEPKYKNWFYLLAFLISLSRIYLGVHYPLDVIIGGLLGMSIGTLSLKLRK